MNLTERAKELYDSIEEPETFLECVKAVRDDLPPTKYNVAHYLKRCQV